MSHLSAENGPVVWSTAALELGEGPRWTGGRLVLVDILSGRLLEAGGDEPGPLRTLLQLDVPLGAVAPVAGEHGSWIAAAGTGIALLDASGVREWLGHPAKGGTPRRMNDAVCDPHGRFWAGSMAWEATPDAGALYRVDHDGTITEVLDGITIPNGPAFSPDGRLMYLSDSGRGIVRRFTVDSSGDLCDAVTFVELEGGSPDGIAVDVEGNVWIALWGEGRVHQFTPEGDSIHVIGLPAPQPTAPCLGGQDGRTLFVTTATHGLATDRVHGSGSVYAARVPVPGLPAAAFGTIG